MKRKNLHILLAAFVLVTVSCICGGTTTSEKIGETDSTAPAPPQAQSYQIGDIIQVNDHTIVLNSATLTGGRLHANFTIENKGSDEMAVSSLMQFSAKDSEGVKLEEDIFDCGTSSMGGTILPGDKLKGDICWTGASTTTIKIYYDASLFSSGTIVWQIP